MELKTSKAKLFLIELVIIILFFAFAGAVCMDMFATAKQTSVHSTELTRASMAAQSAAEMLKSGGEERLADMPGARYDSGVYSVYYDADWNAAQATDGVYHMEITVREENGMTNAAIAVKKDGHDVVYSIETKRYEGM